MKPLLLLILIMIIEIKCDYYDLRDVFPDQWPRYLSQIHMPQIFLPSKEITYIDTPGYYVTKLDADLVDKIITIRFYSPDPTKQIVFYYANRYLDCGSSDWVNWFDGWNIGVNVVIPYPRDHPWGFGNRFSYDICFMRHSKLHYTSAQNFAEFSYKFSVKHKHGIGFFIYFKDNPKPCHALIMDSQDVNRKCPFFNSFTLQNYGDTRMNCTLFIIKQQVNQVEGALRIKKFSVGNPNKIRKIHKGEKKLLSCDSYQDHLHIVGNIRPGPEFTREIDFCNEDYPELNRPFPVPCPNITIRLVSSGKYRNKVVLSYLPSTSDEICSWREELKTNSSLIYHKLYCQDVLWPNKKK